MAFDDALFQLGMDLTRSSTAQKEDHAGSAVAHNTRQVGHELPTDCETGQNMPEDRKDFFIERDGVRYAGNHLIIDLFGASKLDNIGHVERTLKRCVEVAGASLLHIHLHHFEPNGGVSGVAVLSESHISIHSWPEADYAALDVFMCGEARPELCIDVLKEAFEAENVVVKTHQRGEELDLMAWQSAASKEAPVRQIQAA